MIDIKKMDLTDKERLKEYCSFNCCDENCLLYGTILSCENKLFEEMNDEEVKFALTIIDDEKTVNHPSYYEIGNMECIDVMIETQGIEAVKSFCICNTFKYIYRWKNKNGVEDIKKAKWYIDKYLELEWMEEYEKNTI